MVVARLPLAHVCSEQHMLAWQWPVVEADCPKRDKSGKSICRSLWDAMEASGTFLQFFQENLVSLFFTKIFFFSRKENCWDRKVGKTAVCQTFLSHPLRPHPHRTRNASKWDLLMWIGVSTLHASNIKGFAFEFVHASSVDWAWLKCTECSASILTPHGWKIILCQTFREVWRNSSLSSEELCWPQIPGDCDRRSLSQSEKLVLNVEIYRNQVSLIVPSLWGCHWVAKISHWFFPSLSILCANKCSSG